MDRYQVLEQIIKTRRSVRKFREEPVPESIVHLLIECARWAPSATNRQPWRFIAVTRRESVEALERIIAARIEAIADQAVAGGQQDAALKLKAFGHYATFFKNAPLVIVCVAEPYRSRFTREIFEPLKLAQEAWQLENVKSVCFAVQNLLLAAHALGYGACPMSLPGILAGEELKKYLGLKAAEEIVMVVPVGLPEGVPAAPGRKEVLEILSWIRPTKN
ncbi:MAG: nitroreductase family protein [Peptococcaceae bacterium]|nr:nitroreductase family protein [Peptococcaceae bacterium]